MPKSSRPLRCSNWACSICSCSAASSAAAAASCSVEVFYGVYVPLLILGPIEPSENAANRSFAIKNHDS